MSDKNKLFKELNRLSKLNVDKVVQKNITQIFNRASSTAKRQAGGTPFKTGELRQSRSATKNEFGYTKEYAPAVEFGTARQRGQHYLKKNVDIQKKIYENDLLNLLKGK